jgi:uncharacterized membrane protein YjgN (DUF898 family)
MTDAWTKPENTDGAKSIGDDVENDAGSDAARKRIQLVFKGNASEYFRIWIVNLALTLATLGIYSAWAKVRRVRYIYGNTFFSNSAFDYLAEPRRILTGRAIAAVLIVIWFVTFNWGPLFLVQWGLYLTIGSYVLFAVIAPFLIYKALRFRLFSTAHRGMQFGFLGRFKESFIANGLWLVLGLASGFLLYPLYVKRRIRFLTNNARLGIYRFRFDGGTRDLYKIYGLGALMILGAFVLFIAVGIIAWDSIDEVLLSEKLNLNYILARLVVIYLIMILFGSFIMGFIRARIINYTAAGLAIANTRFEAHLSGFRLGWIYLSNLLALLVSFGLLGPWAKMRATRYRVENVFVLLGDDIDSLVDFGGPHASALGEEAAGLFDVDFGL